jgi:hypothetical protein
MAIENGRDHVCDNCSKESDFFWYSANWQSSPWQLSWRHPELGCVAG